MNRPRRPSRLITPRAVEPRPSAQPAGLSQDIEIASLHGIGPKRAAALRDRGIIWCADALFHLPYRYVDLRRPRKIRELRAGDDAVVSGTLGAVTQRPMRANRWRRLATADLTDPDGVRLRVVWFNLPAFARMPSGERVLLRGRVGVGTDGALEIVHPEVHRLEGGEPPAIRPVYSLPREVGQPLYAAIVAQAISHLHIDLSTIPAALRDGLAVPSVIQALQYLHRPPSDAELDELQRGNSAAHRALALDEMFTFQLALARERARLRRRHGAAFTSTSTITLAFLQELPFQPTAAQTTAIAEIADDLAQPFQMNRLLLGDVGSGKTLVALWAALRAAECGYQTAFMAPTELLAEQHQATFQRLCARTGVQSALLTGRVTGSERARVLRLLASGVISVAFGTQALIQEQVRMRRLGLAIVDEQHRFGVFERARLMALGAETNVMLMTATPIPRSLALSLFRNLDISLLDEMPPGRIPVATMIHAQKSIAEVDKLVRAELEKGNRAYYVVPLIEGEEDDLASVKTVAERLAQGPLCEFRLGLLHGRMRSAEKDQVMRQFRDGALDVLVATTVVEVGIDVPEATVIAVLAAERYGLAQLHQLRGRVGRGDAPSRCCLVVSEQADARARTRLEVLVKSRSGAEVAEADLHQRGPGDLFGTRQTGALPLRFAHFIHDQELIERAGKMAEAWMRRDLGLELPESAPVRAAIARMLDLGFSLGDVG